MGAIITIINIAYLISFTCSLYIAVSLLKIGKNPLVVIFCLAYCVLCCNILSGVFFNNNLYDAPKAFCFFQGYMAQFITYVTTMSAICFTHETYSLIVNSKRSLFFESRKFYYLSIMIYPLILGIPLLIACLKTDAIVPRDFKCYVSSPPWVRLLGYAGGNLILSFPGTYLSARSAYVLYKHLDQFRSENSSISSSTLNSSSNSQIIQSPTLQVQFSQKVTPQNNSLNKKRAVMTKELVIRMVILSSSFILTNGLASISTIIDVVHNRPISEKVNAIDWIGSTVGVYVFFVFGFSREIRNAWKFS